MQSKYRYSISVLSIVAIVLLVFGCVGITFGAFHDYRAGSSGPHQINKLGYVEITTNVNNDAYVYPGAEINVSFAVTNSTNGGTYGTLPIKIDSITCQKVEYTNVAGDTIELDNGVISYTNISYNSSQTIASGATANITAKLTVKPSATYDEASGIDIDATDYLTNQSSIVSVTLLLHVIEAV